MNMTQNQQNFSEQVVKRAESLHKSVEQASNPTTWTTMNNKLRDWEKEFDEKFLGFIVNDESLPYIRIKDFIRQLLEAKLQAERERIAESAKKLLKDKEFTLNIHGLLEIIYPNTKVECTDNHGHVWLETSSVCQKCGKTLPEHDKK